MVGEIEEFWRNAFTPTALPERRLLGWTRRSMKNRPLEMRWKRAWGKRNEWSLRDGNEYIPKLCGAEVYDWNESEMKYQGSAEGTTAAPGTKWSESGNHILQAHENKTRTIF